MGIKWLWVQDWLYSPDLTVKAASKLRGLHNLNIMMNETKKLVFHFSLPLKIYFRNVSSIKYASAAENFVKFTIKKFTSEKCNCISIFT